MAHKKTFLGMPIIVLVLSLVLLACPATVEEDTWSDVTSLSQLNGTWKSTHSETKSLPELMTDIGIDLEDVEGAEGMASMVAGITVTESSEQFVTINSTTMKTSVKETEKIVFSGANRDQLWPFIKSYLSNWTLNDESYSGTRTSSFEGDIEEDDVDNTIGRLQINQNGTKIKQPAYTEGSVSSPEMIMYKQ